MYEALKTTQSKVNVGSARINNADQIDGSNIGTPSDRQTDSGSS